MKDNDFKTVGLLALVAGCALLMYVVIRADRAAEPARPSPVPPVSVEAAPFVPPPSPLGEPSPPAVAPMRLRAFHGEDLDTAERMARGWRLAEVELDRCRGGR